MGSKGDPQGREPKALLEVGDFTNARVLEIGCGDGQLACRYASETSLVVGIDTKPTEVLRAAQSSDSALGSRMRFLRANAAALPFRGETFEVALLASSL